MGNSKLKMSGTEWEQCAIYAGCQKHEVSAIVMPPTVWLKTVFWTIGNRHSVVYVVRLCHLMW